MERGDEERAALATPKSKPRRVARLARSFPPLTSIPFTAPFVNSRFFPPDDVTLEKQKKKRRKEEEGRERGIPEPIIKAEPLAKRLARNSGFLRYGPRLISKCTPERERKRERGERGRERSREARVREREERKKRKSESE